MLNYSFDNDKLLENIVLRFETKKKWFLFEIRKSNFVPHKTVARRIRNVVIGCAIL